MARRKIPYGKIAGAGLIIGAGAYMLRDTFQGSECTEAAFRKRVVDVARSQVGKRDLDVYFADAAPQFIHENPAPEWCGIFALWCLHQAGLAKNKTWKTGLGFLETSPPLPKTSNPQPGDIAYFTKYSHQAIVAVNNGDGTLEDINGNGAGGVVSVSHPNIADAHAFYSISALVAEAMKGCK